MARALDFRTNEVFSDGDDVLLKAFNSGGRQNTR